MPTSLSSYESLATKITESQLNSINEWFTKKSKPSEGGGPPTVTLDQFKQFFATKPRSFHYPSYAELMFEMELLKAGVTRIITKEQMLYMLAKWALEPDAKHELILAFAAFDTENRGFLETDEIESAVTTYGDVFSKNEVREMMRDANVRGDGNVYYNDFVESMFAFAPQLRDEKVDYVYINPDQDPSVEPEPEEQKEITSTKSENEGEEHETAEEEQPGENQPITGEEQILTGEEEIITEGEKTSDGDESPGDNPTNGKEPPLPVE